jgi:hypothetical protein
MSSPSEKSKISAAAPLLLTAAAGALAALGRDGARYLHELARREASSQIKERESSESSRLLQLRHRRARLRDVAFRVGLDPDSLDENPDVASDGGQSQNFDEALLAFLDGRDDS